MFKIGDRVQRKTRDNPYTGTVVGYPKGDSSYVRVKRDDGKTGSYGDFWQVPASYFYLIAPASLENK